MLQCPNSVFVFFPENVYQNVSSSDVLPQLLECFPCDKVAAVQFLRGGVVRITFKDQAVRDDVLARGVSFQGISLRVVCAMSEVRSVYVRDLPIEVPDDVVSAFLSSYGDVVLVSRSTYKDFPAVCDGNRVVRIVLKQDVPYYVRIADCNCRVWYSRQPVQCVVCKGTGHLGRDCPLSGVCRRCRQPGHIARQCVQAWGPAVPTNDADDDDADDDDVDENNVLESQASVVTVPESSPQPVAVSKPLIPGVPPVAMSCEVPDAVPGPPQVPAKPPAPTPAKSSSRTPRLEQLKVVAKTHAYLRRLLRLVGHVVTETLLERIDTPMDSVAFFRSLVNLTRGRLDAEKREILEVNFAHVRSFLE